MVIKVYISGICGSQEVRKQQQRVLFILQTMPIDLEIIDVTEPGREDDRIFMQEEVKKHDKKTVLPPQIFNGTEYCGDYADFQLANDDDVVMSFLKLEEAPVKSPEVILTNGMTERQSNGVTNEDTNLPLENESNETGELDNVPNNNTLSNENLQDNAIFDEDSDVLMKEGTTEITSDEPVTTESHEKVMEETSEEEESEEESE